MTITQDFQLQLRDLVVGAGTVYEVPIGACVNWWDMAEVRVSDLRIPGRNGVLAGDDLYGGVTLTFSIDINASADPSTLSDAIDGLKAAFARSDVDLPMYGRMLGEDRLRSVRPRRCVIDPKTIMFNWATAHVQVMVVDPFAYSSVEQSGSTTLTTGFSGLVLPATLPWTMGPTDGAPGTIQVQNDGNASAQWRAVITGPIEDPVIENVTTGQSFALTGIINLGDYVALDSKTRTILLNGSDNASNMRAAGARWFDLQPGLNTIQFDAGGEPPYGTLTLTWRSTWH